MTGKTIVPPRPDGFETYADAKKRRAQKIRSLRQGDKDQQRLADKLERCRKGSRCDSGACDVCLRLYRLRLLRKPAQCYPLDRIGPERQSFPPAFYFPRASWRMWN